MIPDGPSGPPLPETVLRTLEDFRTALGIDVRLVATVDGARVVRDPAGAVPFDGAALRVPVATRSGPPLEIELCGATGSTTLGDLIAHQVELALEYDHEVHFFTYELSERYEEINLLYSISETLGSILRLEDAAHAILNEVCDVLAAERGSLWVHDEHPGMLRLVASVGRSGRDQPIRVDDVDAVTARVFREGRAAMYGPADAEAEGPDRPVERRGGARATESMLSVPIRYTPPSGVPRTVGVINLVGRRTGERFSASDQKLLSAIASQVGAALENNRLIEKTLAQERMGREMQLAHDLQMKLLPPVDRFPGAEVGARVRPAEQVGGDFYQLFPLSGGRIGVMIGDVSTHGFPAALIMTLVMSAAAIYAAEGGSPSGVLARVDAAVRDELETTEMYLTLFYGVIDPAAHRLVYANAGHPHAFRIQPDGTATRLAATDPPMGIAPEGRYTERSAAWEQEDVLLLFTDGLSDLLAEDRRGSGEERVISTVVRERTRPVAEIVDLLFALAADSEGTIPADDRTAMIVRL
ncbi:MAG: GAF domain-containing SpoIIE family protein phosphatase [Gemmatimonadota bacterium]|nr:SpoIIE family protein phosphatase [Gemmatimonadota bacterium]